jgi:hypothetical protein
MPPTAPGPVRVVVRPSPLRSDRIDAIHPAGETIADLVAAHLPDAFTRRHAHVALRTEDTPDDELWFVPRQHWHRVRPKPGTTVAITVVPQGGSGGSKILRTVLIIAVVAAAAFFLGPSAFLAGGWIGGAAGFSAATASALSAIAIAATVAIGSALINALLPIGTPKLGELGGYGTSRVSPTLAGSSNQARPWYPIPRVYGRFRMTPPKAARDYTETEGETSWLRCLFCFGYGPLELSDFRIGTVPLAQFEGVDIEVRQGFPDDPPITLYTDTIRTDAYSLKVSQAGGPQTVETRDAAVEIGLDVTFNGLVTFNTAAQGQQQAASVIMRVEYRPVGAADWTLGEEPTVTASSTASYTRSFRFKPAAPGRFEVRVTRLSLDRENLTNFRDVMFITQVRTVQAGTPVRTQGQCLVALRIRATDQLNGTIQDFSAIAEALLPVWNGTTWSAPQKTRTPAWAYLDVLRGTANRRPVGDLRCDLPAFLAWAARSDAAAADGGPRHTFDGVIDALGTVFDTLRSIAAAGRATPGMRDGKFSIVEDVPQTVPIQHFTPRNSWGFKGTRTFAQPWHGVRVRYIDPDRDWSQQEVVVYADGFSEANATRVSELEIFGITRKAQAVREGRYHLAAVALRPEVYELNCDIENLLCTRGDLVRVSHDIPLWGSGWGRVKAVEISAGTITAFTLDELVGVRSDRLYAARWRTADAADGIGAVTPDAPSGAAEATRFVLVAPVATSAGPAPGDLAMVGELGRESVPLLVKGIEPGEDFSAKLTLVDAAPEIHGADTGPIPSFDPMITLPVVPQRAVPQAPVLVAVFSGTAGLVRAGDGTVLSRIGVTLRAAEGDAAPAFQMRWRLLDAAGWEVASGPGPTLLTGALRDGETYEVSARAVSAAGLAGLWTDPVPHLVVGKAEPPSDVQAFTITGRRLDWQAVPDLDLAGYRIRWMPGNADDWGSATPAHGGLLTNSPFTLDALPVGPVTVMIKAVDWSGNESAMPARIVTDLGDAPIDGIAAAATDLKAGGFVGDKVGCTVVSGDLEADADASAPMWASDAAAMWGDAGADMFDNGVFSAMSYTAALSFTDPPPGSRIVLAHTIEGLGTAISWRAAVPMWTADGDPMWGSDGDPMFGGGLSEFLPWPGAVVDPPEEFELRVVAAGGLTQGAIRRLIVNLEALRITESLADVAIASGGTRLPIVETYRAISVVQLTLQGGTGARTAIVADKDETLGPLISVVDGSGTGVAATVDATITGY